MKFDGRGKVYAADFKARSALWVDPLDAVAMNPEVIFDGKTVWVNGPDGHCLARFGIKGLDIHKTAELQIKTETQCIACTHSRPNLSDWGAFKNKVSELYGALIPDNAKPLWLK